MGIIYNDSTKTFHLQAKDTSYIMQVVRSGYLAHLYWGKKIREANMPRKLQFLDRAFSPNPEPADRTFSLDTLPQEYPAYGNTDFRTPAYQVQFENGTTVSDLRYQSHRIFKGKPKLEGLPATYIENENEAESLEIVLHDAVSSLKAVLLYTVYENFNVITRSVRFENEGEQTIKLLRALSMNVDFFHADYELLHLSGAWARERHIERRPLVVGTQSIESRRGASSHQHNPFIALLQKGAGEYHGEVYGFSLVYSGNFLAQVEVDQYKTARVSLGINPFDFTWLLEPGESFQTPEVVMVYSANGLNDMSNTYHKLYRTRLARGQYRDQERPILINNWEATYFHFNEEKILQIAEAGKELGIELFVLDDGWFGKRDNDKSSLGDWFVDKNKLPNGMESLARKVRSMGMQFGLWFEPEMISVDSELYRRHPDWCLHVPNRSRSEGRNQLILDYSRREVCDYVIKAVSDILKSAPISYVKWDMNRHMTEIGSSALPPERQRETAHRYMLGLYRVMEEITSAFPHVLFESCSGGGGRFDPGILYYMPQTWTSDNTDAVSRLKIQYGTSLVYPISAMGAHVSAVPNHQVHRVTSLDIRGNVAMSGNFGYELDLTKLTEQEKEKVKEQVAFYKEIRHLVQYGDFYRILSPFEGNETAWMFVSEDKSEAFVAYFRVLAEPNAPLSFLRLKGLDPNKNYQLLENGEVYGGDELMYVGLNIPQLQGDYVSCVWRLKAC
ncbi:alpha-galactosidase [Anoxybacillus vitaminiphilus]|uniref:Alpha-galactosidase n=1 Tax=Paranoxybacillus vitaminiphilus TaxID=581036 RepID=A0A327YM72_9BACL|nr:alpha-galactosidase [Anoxybacillus vitaminiphilus]RAK22098.1 alpha-galactosidase [Anoxybacillus vitaminiphilus]